jgi:hypothetical protein
MQPCEPAVAYNQDALLAEVCLLLGVLSSLPSPPFPQGGPGSNVSDYSHGTGFLNWWGWDPVAFDRTFMTTVTAPARRGATILQVPAGNSCSSSSSQS